MWRRSFLWPLLLLAGSVLALMGIIQVWVGNAPALDSSRSRKGPEVPKAAPLRDQRPLSAFAEVSARNLFTQSRTGPGLGGLTSKTKASLEGRLLLGIIIIGEERAALIGGGGGAADSGRRPNSTPGTGGASGGGLGRF